MPIAETAEQGSSTVNRALRVLAEIGTESAGVTATELARRTGVNRVTVHRILSAFKAHGFVRQPVAGGPYCLGFKFLELAERVLEDTDVARLAHPLLELLAERSGETCHFAVLDGTTAVYVAKVESPQAVRLVSRIGVRVPLYCTSLGKALISAASPALASTLMDGQSFEPITPTTIATREALETELVAIRDRGYAFDLGENEPGVCCVGAAVLSRSGEPIGAISVSGPEWRTTDDRLAELGQFVSESARMLSQQIAGRADPAAA
ncbi:MAG: IclR family transcriptional regulator [Solirubrobacterales bacterium]|nr:IclR family transcriptional regulator [Solirubrobacterales bacterium]